MTVSVVARGLFKAYRDGERRIEVLRGVDLIVDPGDLVAVVGQSGTGKSTLLHLLGALDRPDSGSIVIGGADLSAMKAEELATFRNQAIGFVFQFHELLADFTALETARLPAPTSDEEAAALAPGTYFLAPDGSVRQTPTE